MTELDQIIFREELYRIKSLPTVVLTKIWSEISETEKELLSKILAALKLSLDKVQIHYQPELNLARLPVKPERVIYFGALPAGLSYYELIQTHNLALVAAEDLTTLLAKEAARKLLWNALKQLFSV
ncbi:MAG: DNA polymerase III subunit psi [Cyclobacteriaceae bacterium]|nr:DNA polymerase III subunit psi [Cyclobacteriaceae bacterium]